MLCDVIEVRVQGLDTIRMDRPLPFGSFGLCFHVSLTYQLLKMLNGGIFNAKDYSVQSIHFNSI